MKKVLFIFSLILLTCGAYAQADTMHHQKMHKMGGKDKMSGKMKDCVMMKDGAMMVMKDGKTSPMEEDMTMSNGTKVMKDGKMVMKDGTTKMLENGDCVHMDGKMEKMEKMEKMKKMKKM